MISIENNPSMSPMSHVPPEGEECKYIIMGRTTKAASLILHAHPLSQYLNCAPHMTKIDHIKIKFTLIVARIF